jgi:hypothetical protein
MVDLAEAPVMPLAEALNGREVVAVSSEDGHEYIVLADRSGSSNVSIGEIGSSAPSPWTSWIRQEYNVELQGQNGLRIYDKMRRNDGAVRGTLRLVKTPVLSANWFVEPASDSSKDKNIANFVWKNLTDWSSMSWSQFLQESLLMLDFGYYMFEKVFARAEDVPGAKNDPDAKGKIVWKKFAPRHPMDVKEWHYDANGGPSELVMYGPPANATGLQGGVIQSGGVTYGPYGAAGALGRRGAIIGAPSALQSHAGSSMLPYNSSIGLYETVIDISKLLVFSFDKEAGNLEGISLLRTAYKHWYYKDNLYKIDAIQKERHGIGIPIVKLPMNYTEDDKKLADQIGRNLRTNERAHVVLPPAWEIIFAKLEGQPVNALASAQEHDKQIEKNILAPFLDSGSATKAEDQAMFLKGTRFIADIVIDTINRYAIPQLVDYNWSRTGSGYPKLRARRIGEQADWRTMSFAVRNYVGAGIIEPDDVLEKAIRDEMALPPKDPETVRVTKTPQNPGAAGGTNVPGKPAAPKAGPPRQSPTPPSGTGGANTGKDASGGK